MGSRPVWSAAIRSVVGKVQCSSRRNHAIGINRLGIDRENRRADKSGPDTAARDPAFSMARSIMAGVKLGVYDAIGRGAATAAEVAAACQTDPGGDDETPEHARRLPLPPPSRRALRVDHDVPEVAPSGFPPINRGQIAVPVRRMGDRVEV
jgi:hypothetical protein